MDRTEVKTIRSFTSTILDLPPSCLEFSLAFPEFFVVGTYYLEQNNEDCKAPQERSGSLSLFHLQARDL